MGNPEITRSTTRHNEYVLLQQFIKENISILANKEPRNAIGWHFRWNFPTNCITGFFVRQNGDILFNELLKQDIFIMPGGTPCYFRVSHLGVQSEEDLDDLAMRIKEIEYR